RGGVDKLLVYSPNGLINVPLGIRYDGGIGFDSATLQQTGGPTQISSTYNVGRTPGSGVHTTVGTGAGNTQTLFFQNLAPLNDAVPAATLTVNATPANNAISYAIGTLVTQGKVTVDEQESIEFTGKTSLTINAGSGTDTASLN